jgi:hypothetical protein
MKRNSGAALGDPRSCTSKSCVKRHGRCANFHSYKDLMGDARCLLEISEPCHSQPRTVLAPSTCHHSSKWPECNCAPAMLNLTSCLSQKCNNTTPLGTRIANHGIAQCFGQGPLCLKIKSSFHLFSSYVQELKTNGASLQPGHCTTIRKHHPSQHEVLTWFGDKSF